MVGSWSALDWGTVPAFVGGLVTAVSALIAVMSYRRKLSDEKQEQAARVAAWVDESNEGFQRVRRLHLVNRGDDAIYGVVITTAEGEVRKLAKLLAKESAVAVLTTEEGISVRINESDSKSRYEEVFSTSWPTIGFVDAMGRVWNRDSRGRLHSVRERRVPWSGPE
jgi:hypothetical protein